MNNYRDFYDERHAERGAMRDYHYTELPPSIRLNKTLSVLKRLVRADVQMLDVGCGDATVLSSLNRGERFGTDISLTILDYAAANKGIRLTQAYGDHLPFADNSFDVVTCMEVLEHVPNPPDVIAELRRVAKRDGKVLITVPAASWWRTFNYKFRGRKEEYLDELEHITEYSRFKLKRFTPVKEFLLDIEEQGLQVEKLSGSYFVPEFLEWRIAPTLNRHPRLRDLFSLYDMFIGILPIIRCMGRYLFIECKLK